MGFIALFELAAFALEAAFGSGFVAQHASSNRNVANFFVLLAKKSNKSHARNASAQNAPKQCEVARKRERASKEIEDETNFGKYLNGSRTDCSIRS